MGSSREEQGSALRSVPNRYIGGRNTSVICDRRAGYDLCRGRGPFKDMGQAASVTFKVARSPTARPTSQLSDLSQNNLEENCNNP